MGYSTRRIDIACRVSRHNSTQDVIDDRAVERLVTKIRAIIEEDQAIDHVVVDLWETGA